MYVMVNGVTGLIEYKDNKSVSIGNTIPRNWL